MSTDSNPGGDALADGQTLKMSPDQMQALLAVGAQGVTRELRGWQPPSVEDLQVMLPQYEITAFIARGGMGAVYKGVQPTLDRTVAIKILPPDIVDDGEVNYAERFKQEARAMAKFKHPGIVTVYDAGETPEGLLYFVMEFIEGTDVAHLVSAHGQLPPEEAIRITTAVCDALAYAHARGVVHRDIKPSNIMIDADGQVKVADFGLAKITTHESSGLTKSRVTMGTPDFVAPEALVAGALVDQRADIYAVGVMLYQMLTGQVPRGRFSPISEVVPDSHPKLDAIVDKAMQKEREKHYSTAGEMKAEVESVAPPRSDGFQPSALATTAGTRRSLKTPLLIAAALSALGAGAFFLMRDDDAGRAAGPAETNAAPATLAGASALPSATPKTAYHPPPGPAGLAKTWDFPQRLTDIALVQDDRRLLYSEYNTKRMALMDLASGDTVWETSVNGANVFLVLPSGQQFIRLGHTGVAMEAHLVDVEDARHLAEWTIPYRSGPPSPTSARAVSPDGRHVCIACQDRLPPGPGGGSLPPARTKVWVLSTDTLKLVAEWEVTTEQLYSAAWLDGQRFLLSTAREEVLLTFDLRKPGDAPVPHLARLRNFIAADPAGKFLVGSQGAGLAMVPLTGDRKPVVLHKKFGARAMCFGENGLLGVLEINNRDLAIFDLRTGSTVAEFHVNPPGTGQMLMSRDGSFALTKENKPQGDKTLGQVSLWRLPPVAAAMPASATKVAPFTNTLGMKFVPVPGTEVLFCIHETRKQDYAAYAAENEGVDISWKQATHGQNAPVGHGDDHPVVSVSWADAQAFCAWLSKKEGRRYRLPKDREWSFAVGIGAQESTDRDPAGLSQRIADVYPWGTQWPPPARVANLSDGAFLTIEATGKVIEGYEDGFSTTAPVMSFPPNAHGVHDLGGNVWEWCEDKAKHGEESRLGRGGAFDTWKPVSALSSYRVLNPPGYRNDLWGFRIVVEKGP